jgi:hypothetical protein
LFEQEKKEKLAHTQKNQRRTKNVPSTKNVTWVKEQCSLKNCLRKFSLTLKLILK